MGYRIERINEQIREEISNILREELNPNEYGWISITSVKTSKDLKDAVVFVTVFPEQLEKKTLEKLQKMAGYLRKQLSKRIRAKTVPKLRFELDNLTKLVERGVIKPPEGN
jgi:ribosome-binding factor A